MRNYLCFSENYKEKAAQMVAKAQIITLASIDENGYPRPVAMLKIKDEDGAIYVSTGTNPLTEIKYYRQLKKYIELRIPIIFSLRDTGVPVIYFRSSSIRYIQTSQ